MALVEVGLGGRLDATHAWDGGVAAITNVALDHMAWLGDTIPAIAREKAAIIERGDLAVTGATGEALPVIRRRARRVGAPLTEVEPAPRPRAGTGTASRSQLRGARPRRGSRSAADTRPRTWRSPTRCSTRSAAPGSPTVAAGRAGGLRDARVARPAGAARRSDGREVLLDGAHNPAGAAALAQALDDLRPYLAAAPAATAAADARTRARWATRTSTGSSRRSARPRRSRARGSSRPRSRATGRCRPPSSPRRWRGAPAARRRVTVVAGCRRRARSGARRRRRARRRCRLAVPRRRGATALAVDDPRLRDPARAAARDDARALGETRIGPRDVPLGRAHVRDGHPQRDPGFVLRRRPARGGADAAATRSRRAVAQAREMAEEGADLLDIGGESTRPGHAPVDAAEELRRVVPVVAPFARRCPDMPLTIDTTKAAVAEAALDAGADAHQRHLGRRAGRRAGPARRGARRARSC